MNALLVVLLPLLFTLSTGQISDVLLPFIGAPQGISFKADNNKYLTRSEVGQYNYVVAEKDNKDPFTKFFVHQLDDEDMLAFECDGEGTGWFMQVKKALSVDSITK